MVLLRRLRLTTYRGRCPQCGEVRSTHSEQVSTATGAAGTHLGWRALGLASELNKRHGVTMRNTCSILRGLGLSLTPGGLSQALDRVADKLEPYMQQVREGLRNSTVVHADETGWWVGGKSQWLWGYTNPLYTTYRIGPRSSDMVREMLGDSFAGVLVSDCLNVYDRHPGRKSKCVAHHLRAISQARELAPDSAFLREIELLFKATIVLDKARGDDCDFALHVAGANASLDRLLGGTYLHAAEIKIQNRLAKQRPHLLTYLDEPDVDPTNNLAERMLRPAVIARKLSAGSKTPRGVRTFEILKSLAVTCHQQGRSFAELVAGAMGLGLPPPAPLFVMPQEP
jgi:hypothetical protein